MSAAFNVVFWIWCVLLALVAVTEFRTIQSASGDATGSIGDGLMFILAVGLLILSLLVRGGVWWFCR